MRRKLIAGNWKMNMTRGNGLELVQNVVAKMQTVQNPAFDVLICPPFTLLSDAVKAAGSVIAVGSQEVSIEQNFGAFTGDVSANMVADIGATYAIVGHSERRADRGDTNATVQKKAENALAAGLTPVICVGETFDEREAGQAIAVVSKQVRESVPVGVSGDKIVVAYEPVWAIGTGKVATVDDVRAMHQAIRDVLVDMMGAAEAGKVRVLYGGSVKPGNAAELLAVPNVDGALIGGASLKADDFWAIAATQL